MRSTGHISDRYEARKLKKCKQENAHTAETRRRKRWPKRRRQPTEDPT